MHDLTTKQSFLTLYLLTRQIHIQLQIYLVIFYRYLYIRKLFFQLAFFVRLSAHLKVHRAVVFAFSHAVPSVQ